MRADGEADFNSFQSQHQTNTSFPRRSKYKDKHAKIRPSKTPIDHFVRQWSPIHIDPPP